MLTKSSKSLLMGLLFEALESSKLEYLQQIQAIEDKLQVIEQVHLPTFRKNNY